MGIKDDEMNSSHFLLEQKKSTSIMNFEKIEEDKDLTTVI